MRLVGRGACERARRGARRSGGPRRSSSIEAAHEGKGRRRSWRIQPAASCGSLSELPWALAPHLSGLSILLVAASQAANAVCPHPSSTDALHVPDVHHHHCCCCFPPYSLLHLVRSTLAFRLIPAACCLLPSCQLPAATPPPPLNVDLPRHPLWFHAVIISALAGEAASKISCISDELRAGVLADLARARALMLAMRPQTIVRHVSRRVDTRLGLSSGNMCTQLTDCSTHGATTVVGDGS